MMKELGKVFEQIQAFSLFYFFINVGTLGEKIRCLVKFPIGSEFTRTNRACVDKMRMTPASRASIRSHPVRVARIHPVVPDESVTPF